MVGTKIFLRWLPVIFWMGFIFYLSHQPAEKSSELSSGITEILLNILAFIFPLYDEMPIIHFIIRKAAHFFAYFILGILVIHALKPSLEGRWMSISVTMIICILYAISDEIHQLFIPGRSGEIRDVLINSLGAVTGLIVYILWTRNTK